MISHEKDKVPMSSDRHPRSVPENADSQSQAFTSSDRSESFSIPMNYMESHKNESNLVGFTGPLRAQRRTPELQMTGPLYIDRKGLAPFGENQSVAGRQKVELKAEKFSSLKEIDQNDCKDDTYGRNEHLLRSGQLGMCNDPYCTICPTYYHPKAAQHTRASSIFDPKLHSVLYGDAKGWAKRFVSFLKPYIPGVMSPHAKVVKHWNQFFVISCSLAIFIDPLFFFLLSVQQNNKCIVIDGHMTTVMVVLRSITDIVYLLNMLLQFRLAYVAPESTMVRTRESVNNPLQFAPEYIEVTAGELVDIPRKIAMNYLRGYFVIDLLLVIPLPQIIILLVLPDHLGSSGANYAKNLLRAAVLAQYIPRLYRFSPLLIGHSPSGFIFETAWANFFVNLLTVMLSAHIVGSCWYLFGLQRVNECLREACHNTDMNGDCMSFIDCGHGDVGDTASNPLRDSWKKNTGADACFTTSGFSHGIYAQAAALTLEPVITRYVYSLFWGFQQISTLAGNQIPSYFVWEVIFTMGIIGLGLLLFAFLIGNMQNFLQALGRRRLEMSLRRRDVDQWMEHRRLPQQLRRKVLEAERYNWAATRGVNEGLLLESLPEDLQRDIRRHRFKFAKQVWIFALMDDYILDAICARLRQTIYIKGGVIFYQGGAVEHMVFIVRGKLESIGEDGNIFPLSEGNVCGEELVTWCLEHSSVGEDGKKIRTAGQRLLSSRTVRCLTNVEGFTLRVADIEEVTSLFAKSLQNPRIQGAIRYQSPYWRTVAATQIQVAWRSRQKWLKRSSTSHAKHCSN